MAIYTLHEGLFNRFRKKKNSNTSTKSAMPKENTAKKYKFMDTATMEKFKREILKEISKVCKKHKDIVGDDRPYFITDLIFDENTRFYIQILFSDDDEAYDAYLDIREEFENAVKQSVTYRKYEDEGYDIDIGFYDDEEGEICLCINNRLYEEYTKQKRSHNIDPELKSYFESIDIIYNRDRLNPNSNIKSSTIFDNVTFLGEGAAISIALGTALIGALGLAYAVIYNSDPDVIDNKNIKKALKQYCKKHKDVLIFDKCVSKVSKINITDLIDNDIVDDKDAKLIRSKPVVAYAIYDRKNNIMAYALFLYALKDGYCYKLCDKSYGNSKEIHNYVKAQFEFVTRSYGAGLKSIMSEPPGYMTGDITRRKLTYLDVDKDPYPVSRFEYNKIMQDMHKIGARLELHLNQIKSKYSGTIEIKDLTDNNKWNPCIIYGLLLGTESGLPIGDINNICYRFENELKNIGFADIEHNNHDINEYNEKYSVDADNADEYPNISVSVDIYSLGEIAIYVNYSRPIVIK